VSARTVNAFRRACAGVAVEVPGAANAAALLECPDLEPKLVAQFMKHVDTAKSGTDYDSSEVSCRLGFLDKIIHGVLRCGTRGWPRALMILWIGRALELPVRDGLVRPSIHLMAPGDVEVVLVDEPGTFAQWQRRQRDAWRRGGHFPRTIALGTQMELI
jgi:hypothetical protein